MTAEPEAVEKDNKNINSNNHQQHQHQHQSLSSSDSENCNYFFSFCFYSDDPDIKSFVIETFWYFAVFHWQVLMMT